MLEKAPEATGGLVVTREYYKTELADWVLQAIDAGDINELSFAFDIVQSSEVKEQKDGRDITVRELNELKLYDASDVLWGCNAATVAVGAKSFGVMPLGVIASQLAMLGSELKAGRRNSDSDQKLIDMIHESCIGLGAKCAEPNAEEDETAGTEKNEKPEPAGDPSTSLSPGWMELQKAKAQAMRLSIFNS